MKAKERRDWHVYIYFRPWNMEPCYVGKGVDGRWRDHTALGNRHYNKHFASIMKKALESDLEMPVVIIRSHLTDEEARYIEIAFIAAIGRSNLGLGPLCNQTDGGDGFVGYKYTEEHREKLRAAQKIFRTPEWQERNNASRIASIRSPEARAKMSASFKGRVMSKESRAKISTAMKGRKVPREVVEKVAQFHRGKKRSDAMRAACSKRSKEWWDNHPEARKRGPRPEWVKEKLRTATKAYYAKKRDEDAESRQAELFSNLDGGGE